MSVFNFRGFKRSNEVTIDKNTLRTITESNGLGGITWNGITSLKNSDVFTAIDIISKDIASTSIKFNDPESYLDDDKKILKLLNKRPNPYLDAWHFKYIIVANMLLNGNSYVEIVRNEYGEPIELYHMQNSAVSLEQIDDQIKYNYIDEKSGHVRFDTDDVLHFRMFSLDGFNGYSPLFALSNEVGISMGSKKFLDEFFKNGGTSTSILKYEDGRYSDEELALIRQNFENSQLRNNNGLVMLDDTMSFDRLKVPTEVLNFLNSYKFSTQQVAKAFGLPVSKLGIETVNTSLKDSGIEYYRSTLYPIFSMMNSEIEEKLFGQSPYEVTLDYDVARLIDSDPQVKLDRVTQLFTKKIITLDEARAQFGYKSVENGSEPLADLNTIFLKDLSSYQNSKVQKNIDSLNKGGESNVKQSD
ncbi:TPA: phage portal protein [Staphylococcus pseudintermedius]|uniref:Phage portal protein n=1 Tax=Staphylococcus pseudintermedius TaxID=283734 RepID=A0A317ZC94_STAPS|nr:MULTISPECIES: phage portal protein [Staphylococcus]ANS89883.1 Phage portal protein [Staphylococcus pseudintermedius]EGQ0370172.1 phage portal protein [Staphylococcus pseudintermedius]EGQ1292272.1 phage portal protein [Staphylococcus pseudintermedius]EGQ1603784.1 phage portal protein [Staphylococcus pseudintermedius]EGQ1611197.1 phage portal protein [Staphylococcus pseudintermedius]